MADATIIPFVIYRQEAIADGLDRYFTGEPCASGHISQRLTKSRVCVECRKLYSASYRKSHPDKILAKRTFFNERYYKENKQSIAEKGKVYRQGNQEILKKRKRTYYTMNSPAILAKVKSRYQSKRKEIIAQAIAWAKANRDKRKSYESNRRACILRAGGRFSAFDIERICKAQRFKCAICRCCIKVKFHIDHIIALANGGSNWPRNLQLLCPSCNMKKHTADPIEYMQSLGYLI